MCECAHFTLAKRSCIVFLFFLSVCTSLLHTVYSCRCPFPSCISTSRQEEARPCFRSLVFFFLELVLLTFISFVFVSCFCRRAGVIQEVLMEDREESSEVSAHSQTLGMVPTRRLGTLFQTDSSSSPSTT